jgi:hypothetical protein
MFRLSLLVFPLFVACALVEDEAAPVADPITSPLVFSVRELPALEDGNPAPPELFLAVRTEEEYGCVNYPIVYDLRLDERVLDLEIEGTGPIDLCLTAFGPASARVPLEALMGTYTLRLAHLDRTDFYRLTIRPDRVELVPLEVEVSRAEEELVWRFPVRSFAYSCGTFTGEGFLCEDFEAQLREAIPLTPIAVPDSGRWPYPLASAGYYNDTPARFYTYEREEDFQQAGALLAAYSRDVLRQHEGEGLSLTNWRGEGFYSWVLER